MNSKNHQPFVITHLKVLNDMKIDWKINQFVISKHGNETKALLQQKIEALTSQYNNNQQHGGDLEQYHCRLCIIMLMSPTMPYEVYNQDKDKAVNVFKFDTNINTKQKSSLTPNATTTALLHHQGQKPQKLVQKRQFLRTTDKSIQSNTTKKIESTGDSHFSRIKKSLFKKSFGKNRLYKLLQ